MLSRLVWNAVGWFYHRLNRNLSCRDLILHHWELSTDLYFRAEHRSLAVEIYSIPV